MKMIIKSVMMAIALFATTAAMAQAVDGTTGATSVNSGAPDTKVQGHKLVCPHCGAAVDSPSKKEGHKKNRHGRKNGDRNREAVDSLAHFNMAPPQFPGRPGMHPGFPGAPAEVPQVGTIVDVLPDGAMAFAKDGKQMFNCFGAIYEAVIEKGVLKFKVSGVMERPAGPMK